ncbi:MAG: ABC transporter ATP-binding protein [Gemmatimonadota bacterium]|nr:ABC transporter ATP-binding protein [Gemmatimonadota bacterium]
MSSACLAATDLHKDYPSGEGGLLHVLKGLDLKLGKGESISILGPSGAGKSTLLHILGGLEMPSQGTVELGDKSLFKLDDRQRSSIRNRSLGFVFQFHYLLAEFTALENVSMPLRIRGEEPEDANKAATAILAEVGLARRLSHKPAQLSGGEQQRVAVARSLVHQPDFVLADEPTGNLDKDNSRLVTELLFEQIDKRRMGFVLVTHDEVLAELTKTSYHLGEGKLKSISHRKEGTRDEVR